MSATPETFDDPDRSEHLRASPPLLPWPMLDRFTRVHPAVPALLYLPVVAVLVGYALDGMRVGSLLAWAVVGYGLWTLTEYWLHRLVFHFEPEDGLGAKLHWLIHGVHHEHPNDPNRLDRDHDGVACETNQGPFDRTKVSRSSGTISS